MSISEIKGLFLRIASRSIVNEVLNGKDIDEVVSSYPGLNEQQIELIKSLEELKQGVI